MQLQLGTCGLAVILLQGGAVLMIVLAILLPIIQVKPVAH